MPDTDPLREAALAATAGPWHVQENGDWDTDDGHVATFKVIGPDYIEVDGAYYIREADARHIALASPDRVLALLDEVALLRAALDNLAYHAAEIMVSHEDATLIYTEWADFADAIDKAREALRARGAGR